MTPKRLGEIGFRWRDHLLALWGLALMYRKPGESVDAADALGRRRGFLADLAILVHPLPHVVVLALAGRLALAAESNLHTSQKLISDGLGGIGVGIGLGIGAGILGGILIGIGGRIGFGIVVCIAVGISVWMVSGIVAGIVVGVVAGILGGVFGGIGLGMDAGIFGGIGLGIVIGTGVGISVGIGVGIGTGSGAAGSFAIVYSVILLRFYYLPVFCALDWSRPPARWYDRQAVYWDDVCLLPFPGLDRMLVDCAGLSRSQAETEINRLIRSCPSQRHQALRARARLLARDAAAESDLTKITEAVQQLPTGDKAFLVQTAIVKEGAARVGHLQVRFNAIDRPVFRESTARQLIDEIERFRGEVSGLREPLASEFGVAALGWKHVAERQLAEVQSAVLQEPVHQVFRAGDPVNRGQEAFIPRVNVIGRLEQQVMLANGCPGVILYGRRRRGKSSALRNLTGLGLLPVSVRTAVISMQDPKAFSSLPAFAARVSEEIAPNEHTSQTLPDLFDLLSRRDRQLFSSKERLILALDEYENLDLKIGEGVFSQDLLATIRESIQTHRNITWLFAGSHTIEELPNAPWTSYLVSARTIEVPNFTLDETRLLLTEPMKYSQEWAKDSTDRPRFDSSFWGDGGIDRIQHETDGWPHLVQLIAETCVDLVNEGITRSVTTNLLEKALDEAVVRGHTVMYELMHRESELAGEWQYISCFRDSETQPAPEDVAVRRSLLRREVAIEDGAAWRLRVPLMGRWLRQRG